MSKFTPITVVTAHFEDLLARGLADVIESDPNLQIVAADVERDRLGLILRTHRPRVAILDADALENLAVVRELSHEYRDTHLVLLARDPAAAECAQALAFGASACLGRDTQARDVLSAIHLASRGLQLIPRASRAPAGSSHPVSALLTRREADVLPLLARRHSNAQIAAELHISAETVRSHARNIFRKLGVSSRRELAALPERAPVEPVERPPARSQRRWGAPAASRQRRPGARQY